MDEEPIIDPDISPDELAELMPLLQPYLGEEHLHFMRKRRDYVYADLRKGTLLFGTGVQFMKQDGRWVIRVVGEWMS